MSRTKTILKYIAVWLFGLLIGLSAEPVYEALLDSPRVPPPSGTTAEQYGEIVKELAARGELDLSGDLVIKSSEQIERELWVHDCMRKRIAVVDAKRAGTGDGWQDDIIDDNDVAVCNQQYSTIEKERELREKYAPSTPP